MSISLRKFVAFTRLSYLFGSKLTALIIYELLFFRDEKFEFGCRLLSIFLAELTTIFVAGTILNLFTSSIYISLLECGIILGTG